MEGNNTHNTAIDIDESRIPESDPRQAGFGDQSTANSGLPPERAETDGADGIGSNAAAASTPAENGEAVEGHREPSTPISKNQLKKLKRQREYEEKREDRKRFRKEKKHDRRAKKRVERDEKIAAAEAAGLDPNEVFKVETPKRPPHSPVPVAFILDCDFEQYMRDLEIVSLSSQVVRSYSQNRLCNRQAHLFVSSFRGKMRTRFETVLANNHKKWTGAYFVEDDFRAAARQASELMAGPKGGEMLDILRTDGDKAALSGPVRDTTDATPIPEPEPDDVDRSIVYLTSESPYTLDKLEPYTSYVIGGLVDRNREKGICYKRATEMKVRTAKLPIGEYMAMQSRFVLTTNQVVEIMGKWLECGDWAEAFLGVIPKRKGGTLKGQNPEAQGSEADTRGSSAPDDGQGGDGDYEAVGGGSGAIPPSEPPQSAAPES